MKKQKNNINFLNNNLGIICSCISVGVLLLIVYAVRNIYPFGTGNISYYDMAQSNVPITYFVYDFLHGDVGMWWNWQLGAGSTMADAIGNNILSPFNLLFLFVRRNKILECMSWLLVIKVCACAASMSFYAQKRFYKLGAFWHAIMGILYASGGFILQYYTNIHFLDIVVIFPLVVYGCDCLLDDEKPLLYVIMMAIGLINNIQMMSMVCWFVLLYAFYPIREMNKEERKRAALLLGVSTVIAICISACITLPVLTCLFHSSRSQLETNEFLEYLFGILVNQSKNAKLFMVYGSEIGISALIYWTISKKKCIKEVWRNFRMVVLLLIPIPFELVNRNWHIGGYVMFPMRFGYMLTFAGLALLGSLLMIKNEQKENILSKYAGLLAIACIPFLAISLYGFSKQFMEYGIRDDGSFVPYWSLILIIVFIYLLAFVSIKLNIRYIVFGLAAILQFTIGWYGFLAPKYETSPECTDDIVYNSERLRKYLREEGNDEYNFLNRIKDVSISLNSNFGNVVGRASIASWTYGINPNMVSLLENLGYNSNYIRTSDGGGTVFSDAFFHVGTAVSYEKLDEILYETEDIVDEYFISKANYLYPFGVVTSQNTIESLIAEENTSAFKKQNELFRIISGDDIDLINIVSVDQFIIQEQFDEEINGFVYEYSIPVEKMAAAYLSVPCDNQYMFWLNGEKLVLHDLAMPNNEIYPGFFVNGLISLGVHEDSNLELKIVCAKPINQKTIEIGLLSVDKLKKSIQQQNLYQRNIKVTKNGLDITINGVEKNKFLLLPMAEMNSFQLKLNGQKIATESSKNDALVLIALNEGNNELELRYIPDGLYVGFIITVIGVVLLVLIMNFKNILLNCKWFSVIVLYMYYLIFWIFMILVYILPILLTIIVRVKYSGL